MLMNFIIVSFSLGFIILLVVFTLSKSSNQDRENMSAFECGFSVKLQARAPFSIQFFLIALIFLIFDIELVLLFPYILMTINCFSIPSILLIFAFLFILSGGLFLEWSVSTLEWTL